MVTTRHFDFQPCPHLVFFLECHQFPEAGVPGVGVTGQGGRAKGVWHEDQWGGDGDRFVGPVIGGCLIAEVDGES